MKITWESFVPIIITAASGLIVWGIKIAINAIAASITRKITEDIKKILTQLDAGESRMDKMESDISFIIKTLIERNS